ncbi:MAG TPA: hypothetical protein DDZ51_01500 [Planctomycetaceae bacterium]|nr:hypothetical protein [Planctomycetaceae bacterium]
MSPSGSFAVDISAVSWALTKGRSQFTTGGIDGKKMQNFNGWLLSVNWMSRGLKPVMARQRTAYLVQSTVLRLPALAAILIVQTMICSPATAGLIIDPSEGTNLVPNFGTPPRLDFAVPIPFSVPFQGRFFGQAAPAGIFVADNGNINFAADDWHLSDSGNDIARISPFWDDFFFADGLPNRITAQHIPGSFLAVSWVKSHLFLDLTAGQPFPGTDRSFQALWIESDVTIRGFDFKRDDIAFSYVGHVAGTSNLGGRVFARVALDNGNPGNSKTAVLPGSANGQIFSGDGNLLPWQDDKFLLFRWEEAKGNYDVSINSLTAVPEPSSLVLILGIATVGGVGKFGRRILAKKAKRSQAS